MSAKYEELIEAGAPRLPEGYYYKVAAGTGSTGASVLNVWVCRERRAWFDARLGRSSAYVSNVHRVDDVARICRAAHTKAFSDRLPPYLEPFLGRHP